MTTGEATTIKGGLTLKEAKELLFTRAQRVESKYSPGFVVNWDQADGLGFEVTDDSALMVGDYQGRTQITEDI